MSSSLPSECFSFLQVYASEPMNLQRFFRVATSLKKMIFHRGTFLFGNPANEGMGIGSPKAGKTLDRRSQTGRFAWRPTIRRHFFRMRISHVFIREVTVLIGSLHAGSEGFPRFRVRTATARAFVRPPPGLKTVGKLRSTLPRKVGAPPPSTRHYPRRVESSTRARALHARETRPRRRGVEVSPPFLRTLAASAGRAPI